MVERIVRAYRGIDDDTGKILKVIKRDPKFHKNFPWCLFDGACQGRERKHGYGIIIIFLINILFIYN